MQNLIDGVPENLETRWAVTILFRALRFSILFLVLQPLSCATFLSVPKSPAATDGKNSIVFGQMQFLVDGRLMDEQTRKDPWHTFFDPEPSIVTHLSPYVSDKSLNKNRWHGGKYAFKVPVLRDGNFSFSMPPGKYYFVEIMYLGLFASEPMAGIRTYMSNPKVEIPFVMTFDVPTNRAVYLGTIRHDFHKQADNWFHFKGRMWIDGTNNFPEAKNWFLKLNPGLETNVVDGGITWHSLSQ